MSNIVPRANSGAMNVPEGFSRSEGRALQSMSNREVASGILSNTRLSVGQFIVSTAMQHTTSLAKQAYALADGDEYLASRLGALVDGYVHFARGEVESLRRLS